MNSICNRAFYLITLLAFFSSSNAVAQDVSDKELEQLKKQKEYAVLQKEIAEAEAADLKAKFPDAKSAPLGGTTTINDGAVIESEMISYAAMARASNLMATVIKEKKPQASVVAIYDRETVNNLLSYRTAGGQLAILKNNYCELIGPAAPTTLCASGGGKAATKMGILPGLKIAQSFLGGLVDLTAFLRTNEEVKGHTFVMEDEALVAEVFRSLRSTYGEKPLRLYYPAVFPPTLDINAPSQFLARLEEIRKLRILTGALADDLGKVLDDLKKNDTDTKAIKKTKTDLETEKAEIENELKKLGSGPQSSLVKLRIAQLEAKKKTLEATISESNLSIAKLEIQKAGLTKAKDDILAMLSGTYATAAEVSELLARLRSYNQQFDQFVASLLQINPSGSNLLIGYMRAENMERIMSCEIYPREEKAEKSAPCESFWLQLRVLRAGGNNRIRTHLLLDFFRGGNRLSHSGGSVVQYNLFDRNGRSHVSDTLTVYNDYVKSTKLSTYLKTVNEDGDIDIP